MPRKPSETVQLKLRFPERLRVRIEAEAEKSERSMNAEIVHRLEQSFEGDNRADLVKAVASEAAQRAASLTAKSFTMKALGFLAGSAKPQRATVTSAPGTYKFKPGRK